MKTSRILLACFVSLAPAAAQPSSDSAANIKTDMAFLASDRLKGREAGTPEYDMAANYVADQMKKIGLAPRGDKGAYFQHVPLVAWRPRDEGKVVLTGDAPVSVALATPEP